MKIYISIPISGHNLYDQQKKAEAIKKELEAAGMEAITPFDVAPEKDKPYSYYMGRDIEALLECDAIYMCEGHTESKGCQLEFSAVLIYGLTILNQQSK